MSKKDEQGLWDLHAATRSDDFKFVNHNDTDFDRFREFTAQNSKRFSTVEKRRAMKEISANLQKWDAMIPERWRSANLSTLDMSAAKRASDLIANGHAGSFYLHGQAGAGKTYLAYAIIKRFIATSRVSPSQVKVISEESFLSYSKMGFEGMNLFNKFFDDKYRLYLLDNVGGRESYDIRKEVPLWERLVDHIHSNSHYVIFTSNDGPREFADILGESGQSKFADLVKGRVLDLGDRKPSSGDNKKPNSDSNNTKRANDSRSAKNDDFLSVFDG